MSAVVTRKNRIAAADAFQKMTENVPLYAYIGRTTAWEDESQPPEVEDCDKDILSSYDEIVALKRVKQTDFISVINRYNWTAGTVFDEYTDSADLINDKNPETDNYYRFYVFTDEFNVYKCISNNNRSPSTVKPSGQSVTSFQTPDGYIWKYMYTVRAEDAFEFMTQNWIPCYTLYSDDGSSQWDVQTSAINGSIEHIVVTDGGTGYDPNSPPSVSISGDGSGASAAAIVDEETGEITNIVMTSVGSGYTNATVTITGGGGVGAKGRVVLSPIGGHGKDARQELGAIYKMIRVKLEPLDSDFSGNYSYRTAGLLSKPKSLDLGIGVVVDDSSMFRIGDNVQQESSGANGVVASKDPLANILYLKDVAGTFDPSGSISNDFVTVDILRIEPSTNIPLEADVVDVNDMLPYSGETFYFLDREKIDRVAKQTDVLRYILAF